MALNPLLELERMMDPVAFAADTILPEPDGWQVDFLNSPGSRTLLNACRQAGKSTMTGILATHRILYTPGSLVLLLSPSLRQSGELFKKAMYVYEMAGRPVAAKSETALTLTLMNGSRIVSLPGSEHTVRGYSNVDLLVVDEASRVATELYMSIRPMLAVSGGSLIALSTPYGTRGWWYEAWVSEMPWQRIEVPATQVPRITPEFLEEERMVMGPWWFEQEYMCQFLDAQTQAFSREDIDAAFEREVEAWDL